MKETTQAIHNELARLGELMGFNAQKEVSESLLSLRIPEAYAPRIDLMWSLSLDTAKRDAIAEVIGESLVKVTHLPIVGIEVEGSKPSTKILMSDVANLRSLGAPLGLLVVSEKAERGQYRRASRAIRTLRYNLGDLNMVPVEASWVNTLVQRKWTTTPLDLETPPYHVARGGEKTEWTAKTRKYLSALGKKAGFIVAEPFTLRHPDIRFEAAAAKRAKPMHEMWDPLERRLQVIKEGKYHTTRSEIDLAWLMPLPRALSELLNVLIEMDAAIGDHDLILPDLWDWIPVVGFELDNSPGKHGGGGLLNLSAYSVIGVTYTPDDDTTQKLESTLKTYVQALGLRNVYVRTAP